MTNIWIGRVQWYIWIVEGKCVNWCLQWVMQEIWCQLSEGWGWLHEFYAYSDDKKRELTPLVLCFPQDRATADRFQYSHLLCYRGFYCLNFRNMKFEKINIRNGITKCKARKFAHVWGSVKKIVKIYFGQ